MGMADPQVGSCYKGWRGIIFPTRISSVICSTAYEVPATATVAKESQSVRSEKPFCLPFPLSPDHSILSHSPSSELHGTLCWFYFFELQVHRSGQDADSNEGHLSVDFSLALTSSVGSFMTCWELSVTLPSMTLILKTHDSPLRAR